MSWDDFRFLLAVHEAGGVAGAARVLGVDKATVRRRVEALEGELGCPLIERKVTGWEVSDAGGRAADVAARVRDLVDGFVQRQVEEAGLVRVVRVTAPVFFARRVLMPHVKSFSARHPGITVRLTATNAMVDLGQRQADVAIRNVPAKTQGLTVRKLGTLLSAAYATHEYVERCGIPERANACYGHTLVAYNDVATYCPHFSWLNASSAQIAFRATDTLLLLDAILAGVGFGVLPAILGEAEHDLERLDALGTASDPIYAVCPEELRDVGAVRAVSDWIAEMFRSTEALSQLPQPKADATSA